jgi:hypothetical protein
VLAAQCPAHEDRPGRKTDVKDRIAVSRVGVRRVGDQAQVGGGRDEPPRIWRAVCSARRSSASEWPGAAAVCGCRGAKAPPPLAGSRRR